MALTRCLYWAATLALVVANTILAAPTEVITNADDSQITLHLQEQYAYCSSAHGVVINIRHTLSHDPQGIVTNPDDLDHLLEEDYVFHPENIVVHRCDPTCRHIDTPDKVKVECKVIPEKVIRWFTATKDGQTQDHKLIIIEHRNSDEPETKEIKIPEKANSGETASKQSVMLILIPIIVLLLQ